MNMLGYFVAVSQRLTRNSTLVQYSKLPSSEENHKNMFSTIVEQISEVPHICLRY